MAKLKLKRADNRLDFGTALPELRDAEVVRIRSNLNQARTTFDTRAINALAASITEYGLQQPIVVRRLVGVADEAHDYELVAGERRLRAHKVIGRETIPAIVLSDDNADQSEEVSLIENVQRVDLDGVDLARGLRKLADRYGDLERVGTVVGMSESNVSRVVGILRLPDEVLSDYQTGVSSDGRRVSEVVSRTTLTELARAGLEGEELLEMWSRVRVGDLTKDGVRQESKRKETIGPAPSNADPLGKAFSTVARGLGAIRKHGAALTDDDRSRLMTLRQEIDALLG